MAAFKPLPKEKIQRLKNGRIFIPSPLALDEHCQPLEAYQRLLTLYYIRCGAAAVVPGAHTGEFALNNFSIFEKWLTWVKEMTCQYGHDMILMAAIGGEDVMKKAEKAASMDYDLLMVSPTAFKGRKKQEVINLLRDLASVIPIFGFELQRAIPGSYAYDMDMWNELFKIAYGAKGASFDTYRSIIMLEAAAFSQNKDNLTILTGNDDRIVNDLLGEYSFGTDSDKCTIRYHGGLLGHWATDTHAVANWVNAIFSKRERGPWQFPLSETELSHAVNRCNMVLFDALNDFQNSVWGVKYRLTKQGLLPAPYCQQESGRPGQAEEIDRIYASYPDLTDDAILQQILPDLKKEIGIK